MLFLALSCLQGGSAIKAASELLELEPDGLQLTPGNMPELEFEEWVKSRAIPFSLHHGFDWTLRRRKVWDERSCKALPGATVHAPLNPRDSGYMDLGVPLEIMYQGYGLGTGAEIEEAMERGVTLVVDVSHAYIQLCQKRMLPETWKRLQAYEKIVEVHVSANDGTGDLHAPLKEDTFGISWALEKKRSGIPMVLECYMHRLSVDDRKQQLEFLR